MGIALGLAAAIGWGSADFVARFSSRRVGSYRTLLFMQLFGLVALTAYLGISRDLVRTVQHTTWVPWAWAVAATLLGILAGLALYRSFETGVLSVVSPIAASYAALTVVLSILSGAELSVHRALGIAATLVGVVLSAYVPGAARAAIGPRRLLPAGVGWALLAAGCFGVVFWLLGYQVTPHLGGVIPVWLARVITPFALFLVARPLAQTVAWPQRRDWLYLAGVGVLDTVAFVAAALGLRGGDVPVVSVLASLFSTVTVLLAAIFLREQLHRNQWAGVALISAGIALVSA